MEVRQWQLFRISICTSASLIDKFILEWSQKRDFSLEGCPGETSPDEGALLAGGVAGIVVFFVQCDST